MNYRTLVVAILCVVASAVAFGGAAAEGASPNRGAYLSRSGYIIHPDEVKIEQYIAQRDYDYPLPDFDDLNVITATGINTENAYILVGLKGKKVPFSDLPPLNITFCIDRSGSMSPVMPWVKSCFYIFIDRVRTGDIVSLVDMNTNAQTLIPPTQIESDADRTTFKRQVDRITANGGTDVYAGIQQSYKEVEKNYQFGYVNRVVILTDGMHNFGEMINKDILDLASEYRKKGINISSVLLGIEADTGLMVDVAVSVGVPIRRVAGLVDVAVAVKASGSDALLSTPLKPRPSSKTTRVATKRYFFSIPGSSNETNIPSDWNGVKVVSKAAGSRKLLF